MLTGSGGPNVIDGGPGADTLNGGDGADLLIDTGNDAWGDTLNGGAGDDVLGDAGEGGDSYNGGDGEDVLIAYASRSDNITVSLNGTADDGGAGEGDNVGTDVEDVTTGGGNDNLTGNAADNELSGGSGADTIDGGGGNDGLHGGSGADTLDGGAGRDTLDGGAGADTLKSRDGETDRDACGGGTDTVGADGRDDVSGDCETQNIAPPAAVAIKSIVVTRAGFVVVRITCPTVERSCGGTVIVKTVRRVARRFIRLGQVNYARLRGGDTRVIKARIAKGDRAPLHHARRVKVRAIVTNVNSTTGDSTSATKLATVSTRGL
jgi:hypothetical protein